MGFTPQLVDLNGDGRKDVISGSFPGEIYFFRRQPDGTFAKHEFLKDKNGKTIQVGQASTAFAVDWDADSDLDLLLGNIMGDVHVVTNEGDAKKMSFGDPVKLEAATGVKHGGDSHPVAADWDGDGLLDLLIGGAEGGAVWHRNTGTAQKPEFADAQQLIASSPAPWKDDASRRATDWGVRSKICVVDYDRDGRLDILLGDYCGGFERKPDQTEEQLGIEKSAKERLPKLQAAWAEAFRAYRKALAELQAGASGDAPAEITALRKEVQRLKDEIAQAQRIQEEYQPQRQAHGYVWLFRRNPAAEGDKVTMEARMYPRRTFLIALWWALSAGTLLAQDDPPKPDRVLPIWGLEFSPDGKRLAVAGGSNEAGGAVAVFDIGDGTSSGAKPIWSREATEGGADVSFSSDGKLLAYSTRAHRVCLVHPESGEVVREFDAHEGRVPSVSFAPGDKQLVTTGADRKIKFWEVESGNLLRTLEGHGDIVYTAAISPDGTLLLSCSADTTAKFWDLASGEVKQEFKPGTLIARRGLFSRDGKYFLVSQWDGKTRVRETATSGLRAILTGGTHCADITRDNRLIVTTGWNNAAHVYKIDLSQPDKAQRAKIAALIKRFEEDDYNMREAAAKDIAEIGMVAEPQLEEALQSADAEVRVRARRLRAIVRSPEPIAKLGGHAGDVEVVCFSPDGSLLVTACRGGDIKLWDVKLLEGATFKERATLKVPRQE